MQTGIDMESIVPEPLRQGIRVDRGTGKDVANSSVTEDTKDKIGIDRPLVKLIENHDVVFADRSHRIEEHSTKEQALGHV